MSHAYFNVHQMKKLLLAFGLTLIAMLALIFGYVIINETLSQMRQFSRLALALTPPATQWPINLTPIPAQVLSPSPYDQVDPAIDGQRIVWSEKISGYSQIILFDFSDRSRHQLTSDRIDHVSPLISGENVIWSQGEPGDPAQISGVNNSTGQVLTLPEGRVSQPNLKESSLVWSGEIDITSLVIPIFRYDLETHQTENLFQSRGANLPSISGNIIVWEDWRNENADVYAYDLSAHQEFPVVTGPGDQENPNISEQIVVWRDNRRSQSLNNFDIYGYDLKTHREFFISNWGVGASAPKVSGNFVVWDDLDNVYAYDLTKQTLLTIATGGGTRTNRQPSVFGNIAVWTQWDKPNDRDAHSQIMIGQIPMQP